jgi:hypothetical protein
MQLAPARPEDEVWRERWKAWIQCRARVVMPQLLRSAHTQRLQPLAEVETREFKVTSSLPVTPFPATATPETGPIARRDTMMISAVTLLQPVDVRETRALVSEAVKWFLGKYGCLPTNIRLNPLRCLGIANQHFFALNDEVAALGCYTVDVLADPHVACDQVGVSVTWFEGKRGKRYFWMGKTDSYL